MEGILQSIANGLVLGWMYVLVALGLTIVFSIMRIVQFAHGEIYMLGAYCVYYVGVVLGLNVFESLIISAGALGLVGIALERFFFRRFRGQVESSIIVAIALILLLQTIAAVSFGTQNKWVPGTIAGVMVAGSIQLPWQRLLAMMVGIILTLLLFLFIRKTKVGQAMVAISQNLEGAALQGMNIDRISALSMSIGCAMAAVAGALMGSLFQVYPSMGSFAMAKGIAVIILGGLGSIAGAVIGGLIIGLIDGIVPFFADATSASIIGFILIILILIIRPRGLLGQE
jgi:branched-chain amino acid transport system permease protein